MGRAVDVEPQPGRSPVMVSSLAVLTSIDSKNRRAVEYCMTGFAAPPCGTGFAVSAAAPSFQCSISGPKSVGWEKSTELRSGYWAARPRPA